MTPTNDKKLTSFMWLMGIVITIFCGAGLTVALSYGATKQQTITNTTDISTLKRRSVDYTYIEYLVESNQKLINILQTTQGSEENKKAVSEWMDFQNEILRRANPVRSVSLPTKGGGQ
jgi:hypothetical protein